MIWLDLPAPRMQLRWSPSTKGERRASWCEVPGVQAWTCRYELVLPLQNGDIRRGRSGTAEDDFLIIPMGQTTTMGDEPWHMPFRDNAHSREDAAALGGLPVYLIDAKGNATLEHGPPLPPALTAEIAR